MNTPNQTESLADPWDDGKDPQRHLTECTNDDCDRCNHLIDGFYMACDNCGSWGHQDSDGWVLVENIPFCNEKCAEEWFGRPVELQ